MSVKPQGTPPPAPKKPLPPRPVWPDVPYDYKVKADYETLCWIAQQHTFNNCDPLRAEAANAPHLNKTYLKKDDVVRIPALKPKTDHGATEQLHKFKKPDYPVPKVELIQDKNEYKQAIHAAAQYMSAHPLGGTTAPTGGQPPPPPAQLVAKRMIRAGIENDPKARTLAISNYVVDRGGDGTVPGNFPDDTKYEYVKDGSDDPDHFKVQVYDNSISGSTQTITVTLCALKPFYYASVKDGKTYVKLHPTANCWPKSASRKLTVTCKRVGDTNYFRSPYLRLVTTPGRQTKRPKQTLLVSDYLDEGTKKYEKYHTEILHQKVQATYAYPHCSAKKCSAYFVANLAASYQLHIGLYLAKGTGMTKDTVRQSIYKWARRIFSAANVCPVIDDFREIDLPKNMVRIADQTGAVGAHASGKNASGGASDMGIKLAGKWVVHRPTAGQSPATTAAAFVTAIANHTDLKKLGYKAKSFQHRRTDVTVAAGISYPYDLLVFDKDGKPVEVESAYSRDLAHGTSPGQSLARVQNMVLDNFPIGWPAASPEQRALRWNYYQDNSINIYILGSPLSGNYSTPPTLLDGLGPYGKYKGYTTDVGPIIYLAKTGVSRPAVISHEICHPMMHVCHTSTPKNDAYTAGTVPANNGAVTTELMDGKILTDTDTHDASLHLSDAPIVATYEIVNENDAYAVLDGAATSAGGTKTTPVRRLHTVGGFYNIVRAFADPLKDPDVTDLPADAKAAEAEAKAYRGG